MSEINAGNAPKAKVVAKEFASKYRDKTEVYHFLTHDVGAYLGTYDSMTIWHMKDLISGERKLIKGTDSKHLSVPQYEGLKIETFLDYAALYPEVMKCLPSVKKEREKLPRQYIINVIYTK
jgi:hypothetical protein